jgi:hypothetical protein
MICGGIKPVVGGAGLVGLARGAGLVSCGRCAGRDVEPGSGAEVLTQAPSAGISPITNAIRKALAISCSQSCLRWLIAFNKDVNTAPIEMLRFDPPAAQVNHANINCLLAKVV